MRFLPRGVAGESGEKPCRSWAISWNSGTAIFTLCKEFFRQMYLITLGKSLEPGYGTVILTELGVVVSETGTRATVRQLYDAYERRDFESFAALVHEDIDWIIYEPISVFPFAGLRRGRAAVLQALAGMALSYWLESFVPEVVIVDGDRAAVMADVSLTQIVTGRTLRFRVGNFLRIQDGRLIEFREFADSFDLVEQAIGRAIEL